MSDGHDQLGLFDGGGDVETPAVEAAAGEMELFEYAGFVVRGLEETDLEETLPHLAAELVAMAGGLTGEEERALFLVVLASLVHLQSGSTRMPLDWSDEGPVARRLRPLRRVEEVWVPPAETIGEIVEAVVEEEKAGDIVGEPGEYKPLIVGESGRGAGTPDVWARRSGSDSAQRPGSATGPTRWAMRWRRSSRRRR